MENYRPVAPRKDTPTKSSTTNVKTGQRRRGASISSVASSIVSQASTSLKKKPIIVAPPLRLRDEFLAGENGKGMERVHDRHDSSLSSVSSSFEMKREASRNSQRRSRVLSNPPIFTTEQLLDLRTLLKELDASLRQQDDLCQSFSRNLLYLLAVKESGIKSNKRLNAQWKRGLCRELSVCREELGRVFTRKTGIGERSQGVVRSLLNKLDELENGEEKRDYALPPSTSVMNRKRGSLISHIRDRSSSRSRPPLTHSQHQYSSSLDASPTPSAVLTRETITTSIFSLRKDVDLQRLLDECILDAVTRKCWKERWCRSVNMRIEMRRFVGFLGGRCDSMAAERGGMGVCLTTMEGVLGGRRSVDVEVKEVRRFSWR
ncbi:hypothetical protein BJ875DRAFT_385704 [Amylocarpus encephaloides]|uniref:Uncharacterized protein n=1 Tax=Amylocarpus encephaloides TaxID=45428 RepID=A0A9P8C2Q0_9HELO|nr:hypothetical protein BJ875DRAFT_385704 [Amylocarpus encephaloides]